MIRAPILGSDLSPCYGLEQDMNQGTLSGLVSLAVTGAEVAKSHLAPFSAFASAQCHSLR